MKGELLADDVPMFSVEGVGEGLYIFDRHKGLNRFDKHRFFHGVKK